MVTLQLSNQDQKFYYQYNNLEELFLSAQYVYSTLLKVKNPHACRFQISPSPMFQGAKEKDTRRIYFSIKANRPAQQSITIHTLENLISDLYNYKFEFIDNLIINEELTMDTLPELIEDSFLYTKDETIVHLLSHPMDLTRFELRYINPVMGFGLYAKENIKQQELSFIYAAAKKIETSPPLTYAFENEKDALNMYLDARYYGNIARFINHAPNPKKNKLSKLKVATLVANIKSKHHYLNGIEVIVFSADRDIIKGEQLLVDYGNKFFRSMTPHHFKRNGKVTDQKKKWFNNDSQNKLRHIRIMAKHGIKAAQNYLLLRLLIIIASVILLMIGLKAY